MAKLTFGVLSPFDLSCTVNFSETMRAFCSTLTCFLSKFRYRTYVKDKRYVSGLSVGTQLVPVVSFQT